MSDRGIILCEHAIDENVPERCADFVVIDKQYKFGKIMITAYRRITSNQTELSKITADLLFRQAVRKKFRSAPDFTEFVQKLRKEHLKMKIAVCPGSFDPITKGLGYITRAAKTV